MEFRRYLKERLSQLRDDEALNVTEITSDGKGIRKVRFNPQTARSLIPIPNHKKIIVNKNLKGLDHFLHLQGYNQEKINKIYQTLKGSKVSSPRKISSPRKDRYPPADFISYPSSIAIYGVLTVGVNNEVNFNGLIYNKDMYPGNNVYYYDGGWYQNIKYNNLGLDSSSDKVLIDDGFMRLRYYVINRVGTFVDVTLHLDLLGDGNRVDFQALRMGIKGVTSGAQQFFSGRGDYVFCAKLNGPLPDKIFYGNQISNEVKDC